MSEDIYELHPGRSWRRFWGHVGEMAVLGGLAVLAGVSYAWTTAGSWIVPEGFFDYILFDSVYLPTAMTLFMVFLASRASRGPAAFILASLLFALVFVVLMTAVKWRPFLEDIQLESQERPLPPEAQLGLLVPTCAFSVQVILLFLIPILSALYFVRRNYSRWKYGLGWLFGFVATYSALRWPDWWFDPGAGDGIRPLPWKSEWFRRGFWRQLGVCALLAEGVRLLPLQRGAIERLTGLPLSARSAPAPARAGFAAAFLWPLSAALLFLLMIGGSVIAYYFAKSYAYNRYGPPAPYVSPALSNAHDNLKQWFSRKTSPKLSATFEKAELEHLAASVTREDQLAFWSQVNVSRLGFALLKIRAAVSDFENASLAEYCVFNGPGRPLGSLSFVNTREVSQLLFMRAMVSSSTGSRREALKDLAILLRIAYLLNKDPNNGLYDHGVASHVRGKGISGLQKHYMIWRDDPAAMEELAEFLTDSAGLVEIGFPLENLKRTEAAFWPVVPAADFVVTNPWRSYMNFNGRWAQYDELRLVVALDRFRRDRGEFPDALAELAPAYLKRIPKEPFDGKDYEYENLGGDVRIRVPYLEDYDEGKEIKFLTPIVARENAATSRAAGSSGSER